MEKLADFLKSKSPSFKRGTKAQRKRSILAEALKREKGVKNPFALATWLIKKGAK